MKGVNYFGPKSEYVVSGSDCGHVFLWDVRSEEIVQYLEGDHAGVVSVLKVIEQSWRVQNFSKARNIGTMMKQTHRLLKLFV